MRWCADDGDAEAMRAFCVQHFVADPALRTRLLDRLESAVETVTGHLYEIRRDLRWWTDVRTETCPGVDDLLAKFDPAPDLRSERVEASVFVLRVAHCPP